MNKIQNIYLYYHINLIFVSFINFISYNLFSNLYIKTFEDCEDTPPFPHSLNKRIEGKKVNQQKLLKILNNIKTFVSRGNYLSMLQGLLERDNFTSSRYTPRRLEKTSGRQGRFYSSPTTKGFLVWLFSLPLDLTNNVSIANGEILSRTLFVTNLKTI
jgi:hypothetical protein